MTQANYRPTLALKLASMQTPDAVESSALASFAGNNKEETIAHNLLLNPGEPSEMLVQLENLGSRPILNELKFATSSQTFLWCWRGQ